jgi:hypothetical protein
MRSAGEDPESPLSSPGSFWRDEKSFNQGFAAKDTQPVKVS